MAVGVAAQRSEPGDKAGWIYRDGHSDLFAALGAGKCRMYVIPSLEMVALRQGDSKIDRFDDYTFLSLLLTGQSPDSVPQDGRAAVTKVSIGSSSESTETVTARLAGTKPGLNSSEWFDRLDRDGDGKLDMPELRPLLERRSGNQ